MNVHVQLKPPVGSMLGLSKPSDSAELEVSIAPRTSLHGLFEQLARQVPGCERLAGPDNILHGLMIVNNGMVIPSTDFDHVTLQDQSTIALFVMYQGG